jgi:hypothetical protein
MTKKETKEVSLLDSILTLKIIWRTKKHQINSYLKDVISSVNGADELYILAQQRQKTKLEKK